MTKIETKEQLLDHLSRYVSAYRKSYKFCGNICKGIDIVSGFLGSTAILAVVPAIPIFVAAAGALPAVITIIQNSLKMKEKSAKLKMQHRMFKQLQSYVRTIKEGDDETLIADVFNKILEIQKNDNFVEPLEMYMKRYQLNGYSK